LTWNKYLHLLQQHANYHQLPKKLHDLFLLAASPSSSRESLSQALASFDLVKTKGMNLVKTKGMKYMESHCQHLNMGFIQFSLELKLWWKRHLLWQLVLCRHLGHNIKARFINRLATVCGIANPLGATSLQAQEAFHTADLTYTN